MMASFAKKQRLANRKARASIGTPSEDVVSSKIQRKDSNSNKDNDPSNFNTKRVKVIREHSYYLNYQCKGVVYWMSREQRVQDNWSLIYAQSLAIKHSIPLNVVFCFYKELPHLTLRRAHFMLKGLEQVEAELNSLSISFEVLLGEPEIVIPEFLSKYNYGCLVSDMNPLRYFQKQIKCVEEKLNSDYSFYIIDAHNIVPIWETSNKVEYAARTIRPKIHKNLNEFLTDFPKITSHPFSPNRSVVKTDWDNLLSSSDVDQCVSIAESFLPGTKQGLAAANKFINDSLKYYAEKRNDPNADAVSNLSVWFNFGQISVQRVVLLVKSSKFNATAFIEEAVVRRELSDNFCYYQSNYDNIDGATSWAKTSLLLHKKDKRQYIYSLKTLEGAATHDDLWNAAQKQLVKHGKMHGFLRMYWAKKILEWTESPEQALEYSLYLNDHYSLDGCDPNGFVGCMWSICGIHDTAWTERTIFGKIRYMNYKGCKRKFDVPRFISKYA